MRLLTKTNLYYLGLSIPLIFILGIVSFYFIRQEVIDEIDESLINRKEVIEQILFGGDEEEKEWIIHSPDAVIFSMDVLAGETDYLSDTLIADSLDDGEMEPYRQLNSVVCNQDICYSIRIHTSTVESDDLFLGLFSGLLIVLALLFISFILFNWIIAKKLWRPFYDSLEGARQFQINRGEDLPEKKSSIVEFQELNDVLKTMMDKIRMDYRQQKEFNENASHEIQTPIAIIQAKLELLFQSKNLNEQEMRLMQSMDEATKRISRLSKSMLLLSKIENRQFTDQTQISIYGVIQKTIEIFEEYASSKSILIEVDAHENFLVFMHQDLAEILVSNLMGNAIRHNREGGQVLIQLTKKVLKITNTGQGGALDHTKLFTRFASGRGVGSDTNGLGLAIAKEIAITHGLELSYSYIDLKHVFSLTRIIR